MKLYFAKCLPIEMDAKAYKWQWNNNVQNTGWEDISPSDMDAIIAHRLQPAPEFRKVKLFLCSKEIQVGDEYWFELSKGDWRKGICHTEGERKRLKEAGIFKVIGEISPDAIWVKEGDEFDEEEVRVFGLIGVGKGVRKVSKDIDKEYLQGYICEIKGPCGHFH